MRARGLGVGRVVGVAAAVSWIKVDAAIWMNPKIRAAGSQAAWLYVSGLGYASLAQTNGALPTHALPTLCPNRHRFRLAQRLVDVGLWHVTDQGWEIHDYQDWQVTRGAEKSLVSGHFSSNGEAEIALFPVPELGFSRAGERAGARGREKRREERREDPPVVPPEGGRPVPVYPRGGHRQRERKAYAEDCAAYAAEHFPDLRDGARAVHQAVYYGKARSLEEVRNFLAQWPTEIADET